MLQSDCVMLCTVAFRFTKALEYPPLCELLNQFVANEVDTQLLLDLKEIIQSYFNVC